MAITTAYGYPRDLAFEKMWAIFLETDRKIRENTWESIEDIRELKENQREISLQIKELSRQIGGLHNCFGELAKHLAVPGIVRLVTELGYHFNSIVTRGVKIYGEKRKIIAEIDILLENEDFIVAVDVKNKIALRDLEHHIKQLEILRSHKKSEKRKIRGAIAGAMFNRDVKDAISKAGLYVLEQHGDTMKIELPEDFSPREW